MEVLASALRHEKDYVGGGVDTKKELIKKPLFKNKVLMFQVCAKYPGWKLKGILLRMWGMTLDMILEIKMIDKNERPHSVAFLHLATFGDMGWKS